MIKKEIDGKEIWCFEESDKEIQDKFETAMFGEESASKLMLALVDAMTEMSKRKIRAWNELKNSLPDNTLDENDELVYNWRLNGFEIQKIARKIY